MNGRLSQALAIAMAALLLIPALMTSSSLHAQDTGGRFLVVIPDFFPDEGTDDDFGKDVAKKLRELMDDLPTHRAYDEGEIKDQLKRFDLDMDELDCIKTRQFSAQINTQVALCATYREVARDQFELYTIEFWDMATSQSFTVDGFTAGKDDDEIAAQTIIDAFDGYVQQIRFRQFCYDYSQNKDYESALRNCNQALDLNPGDHGVRYQRARVYFETERLEESLVELETILEAQPFDEEALQLGGYVATQLGNKEEGREYYGRYLQVNPSADRVRRTIAFDLYTAGDPEGAALLIEEGIAVQDAWNLQYDLGNYLFAAADREMRSQGEGGEVTPQMHEFFQRAIDAYMKVFASQPDSMSVNSLTNVVRAYIQLEDIDRAIEVGEEVLAVHPEEAGLWAVQADALRRADRLDEAMAALDEVGRIDPEYPSLHARQGSWLLQAGRTQDAVPYLQGAVERGQDPNQMARLLLSDAHTNGVQKENWPYAIEILELAKSSFDVTGQQELELHFWHGYSVYQRAVALQGPQTLDSARRSLPLFQRAKELFAQATGYTEVSIQQYLTNSDTYIEIQDAIIKRGGSR